MELALHRARFTGPTENGICGSRTSKDLVLGVCDYQPGWMDDPYTINVPGMDCALGIVDFDIYYCKGCAGLCSTESGSGPEPDGGAWA